MGNKSIHSAIRESTKAVWNRQELLERVDHDGELLCDLLRIFRKDSQRILVTAKVALGHGNMPELTRAAHSLKGMLKNLSMNRAAEAAYALEKAASQESREEARSLLPKLEAALLEVHPEVDAYLAEVKV